MSNNLFYAVTAPLQLVLDSEFCEFYSALQLGVEKESRVYYSL